MYSKIITNLKKCDMKNVYFYLIAVAAVILFIFIVYLIEYDDRVLWKNSMVRGYKEKDDPYIKGLTSNSSPAESRCFLSFSKCALQSSQR